MTGCFNFRSANTPPYSIAISTIQPHNECEVWKNLKQFHCKLGIAGKKLTAVLGGGVAEVAARSLKRLWCSCGWTWD